MDVVDLPPAAQLRPVEDSGGLIREALLVAAEWRDPDDNNPNRRTAKVVRGFRRADPLANLAARGSISAAHLAAAERLRIAWEVGVEGGSVGSGRDLSMPAIRSGSSTGDPSERRLAALRVVGAARNRLGPLWSVVVALAICRVDLSRFAAHTGMSRHAALGYATAALDVLTAFYDWAPDVRRAKCATASGPTTIAHRP